MLVLKNPLRAVNIDGCPDAILGLPDVLFQLLFQAPFKSLHFLRVTFLRCLPCRGNFLSRRCAISVDAARLHREHRGSKAPIPVIKPVPRILEAAPGKGGGKHRPDVLLQIGQTAEFR